MTGSSGLTHGEGRDKESRRVKSLVVKVSRSKMGKKNKPNTTLLCNKNSNNCPQDRSTGDQSVNQAGREPNAEKRSEKGMYVIPGSLLLTSLYCKQKEQRSRNLGLFGTQIRNE